MKQFISWKQAANKAFNIFDFFIPKLVFTYLTKAVQNHSTIIISAEDYNNLEFFLHWKRFVKFLVKRHKVY